MGDFGLRVTERDTCKQLGFDLDGTYGYQGRDLVPNLQALGISSVIQHWLCAFQFNYMPSLYSVTMSDCKLS